jgi:ribosomal protein S18 acetylase RimI-like enzyme
VPPPLRDYRLVTVTLRPESPSDEDFIRRLILQTVAEELGASAWPEPMRTHLLGVQYTARRQSHRTNQPEAASHVIQADGVDAGWAVVNTMPHEVRLAEIMVLPEMRGWGIGTAAIHEILSTAAGAGKPVRLNVNVMNHGAIRLYERVGFRKIERNEVQYLMQHG